MICCDVDAVANIGHSCHPAFESATMMEQTESKEFRSWTDKGVEEFTVLRHAWFLNLSGCHTGNNFLNLVALCRGWLQCHLWSKHCQLKIIHQIFFVYLLWTLQLGLIRWLALLPTNPSTLVNCEICKNTTIEWKSNDRKVKIKSQSSEIEKSTNAICLQFLTSRWSEVGWPKDCPISWIISRDILQIEIIQDTVTKSKAQQSM